MTGRDEVRDQIAHAMGWTTGHFGDVLDAIMNVVDPVIRQRDEAQAKLQHAQTYADNRAKHAAVEVLRGDVAWHLRQIITRPPHNCADASCSIQIDACGACCTCLGGCVHNGPDEPTSERYVDVHHLVEAEIQIARLTKDSGGRPRQHDVTQVAVTVAHAFDMDLTAEAESASQPRAARP